MEEKITSFIQHYLSEITHTSFSKKEIKKFVLPILYNVFNNKFNKILISGSQGIGKTSYLKLIEKVGLRFFNIRVLSLSLDNFYLDKSERETLGKNIHPLLQTRGVPGTHDIKLLKSIIYQFNNSKYPINLPIFDKLTDRRKKIIKKISKKCDLLILEGWCVGCPPIPIKYLYKNLNSIEKKFDKNKNWRNFYNSKLKTSYAEVFRLFNYNIFFKTPSFSCVIKWRNKQEKFQKKIKQNIKPLGMTEYDLKNFIQHYEKITKYMLKKIPRKANLVIRVNKNQKILKIIN